MSLDVIAEKQKKTKPKTNKQTKQPKNSSKIAVKSPVVHIVIEFPASFPQPISSHTFFTANCEY